MMIDIMDPFNTHALTLPFKKYLQPVEMISVFSLEYR